MSSSYIGDLPQLVVTSGDKIRPGHTDDRVPITYSWPSLEGHVSVHNPSIDSTNSNCGQDDQAEMKHQQKNVGLQNNFHRISSACDSGYSEMDIYSTVGTILEATSLKENIVVRQNQEKKDQDSSYMEELQLYFNLDKMLDKTSHEDSCFKELDLSICSDDSKDCSCSEYSCSFPAQATKPAAKLHNQSSVDSFASANSGSMTNSNINNTNNTVMTLAQLFQTNSIKNLHDHNVSKKYLESMQNKHANNLDKLIENASMIPIKHFRSKVSREDSSRSLPTTTNNKDSLLSNNRRLSLPKVTQLNNEVIVLEQAQKSREIFI